MAFSHPFSWEINEASELISIGDRKLHLNAAGPPRVAGQPVVVVEAGMGDDSRSWTTVATLVSKFARIYTYDRAGSNKSKPYPGPEPRTAAAMARDLSALLATAKVPGPYLVVCHSYGGLIAREFLALRNDEVAGMIFVDTNTERTSKEIHMPMEAFGSIASSVNFYEATGLNRNHKIDPEIWASIQGDSGASGQERAGEPASVVELAEKNQFKDQVMGERPVVVLMGNVLGELRRFYDAAVEKGAGSEEDRGKILEMVEQLERKSEGLQREQLKLSSRAKFVKTVISGHNVQFTEPELIAGEIEKVLSEINR